MSTTDSTKEGILAYLLKSEKTIESIAFYNEEIAIRMLKQVTTIVISHGHFYYCHFSCVHGETQGQTKNHYKNKCQRHVGFDNLSGAGYFDHRGRYSRIQYVLGQDEKLSSPPQMFIDRDHTYRIIRFYGEHDKGEYYCKEVQNLRHKFTAEEDRIILANVMKYSCLEGIELLFKDPEVQKQLTCTYCQLCRRAAYFAQRYISDDLLIAQLVQKHQLIVEIKKDPATGILLSMGVANPVFLKLFAMEGEHSSVMLDYTHIRVQQRTNYQALLLTQCTSGSHFSYVIASYIFKDPNNSVFSGESKIKLIEGVKFFHSVAPCLKDVRLCLTDQAKSFDYAAGLISQHCTSGLCGYHFYVNNFKITGLGADACKVRDLFFNLLRAPTECDKQFRMKALEAKLKEINKFDKDKWKNLVDNEDRLILCYRSKSSLSASLQVTTSAGEAINYHKIKRYLHSRSRLFQLVQQLSGLHEFTKSSVINHFKKNDVNDTRGMSGIVKSVHKVFNQELYNAKSYFVEPVPSTNSYNICLPNQKIGKPYDICVSFNMTDVFNNKFNCECQIFRQSKLPFCGHAIAAYGYYKAIELNNMKITFFKSLIPERYTTQYLMRLFSVFNYPEIQLFNHCKRENLLRLLDNVNSEITENNTDSSEEESCSSSESSTSEHETESAEVNQDRRKNSIKQLIAILDDPRLKNEDIESAMIYLNKILECKDFLNPNPNRNSAGSEKRIQPFTEKLFKKLARQVTLE